MVWFGYGCEHDWNGRIGKLDTAVSPPTVELDQQGDTQFHRAPLLTAATSADGPLVAGQLSLSLSRVQVYETAGGDLDPGASGTVVGAGLADLDLTSTGDMLLSAAGSRNHVEAFAPDDLSQRGSYNTGPHPNSAAVSPDDAYVATAVTTSGDDDVLVYQIGGVTPVREIDIPRSDAVARRGLAWSGDLKRLFVVTQRGNDLTPDLHVIRRPTADDHWDGRVYSSPLT